MKSRARCFSLVAGSLFVFVFFAVHARADQSFDILVPSATESGSVELNGWHCYDIPIQNNRTEDGMWDQRSAYRVLIILRRYSPLSRFEIYASDGQTPTQERYQYANLDSAGSPQTLNIEGLVAYEHSLTTCVFGKTAGSFAITAEMFIDSKNVQNSDVLFGITYCSISLLFCSVLCLS